MDDSSDLRLDLAPLFTLIHSTAGVHHLYFRISLDPMFIGAAMASNSVSVAINSLGLERLWVLRNKRARTSSLIIMAEWAIETHGLNKRYGYRQVLHDIDLRVAAGEFLVLIGPNGAGKSTLLRILCTLMKPTSGQIKVGGYDIADDPDKVRATIGLLAHSTYLYDDLTAAENLRFYLRMRGHATLNRLAMDALKMTGLEHVMHNRVRTFSTGMKKRLSIAKLVASTPRILFLDEPYSGLDDQGIRMLNRFLISVKTDGCTVFMVTHHHEQGLATGDRVLYLHHGKLDAVPPVARDR